MTQAAEELHLTQSGVSQHIRALEEDLGITLFDRLHRRLVPTPEAEQLQKSLLPAIDALVNAMEDLSHAEPEIAGTLKIGLPVDIGTARILPILSELGKEYPELKYEISLDYASHFNELLLEDKLDFAIVDSYELDPLIEQTPIADEKLIMCADANYLKKFGKIQWNKSYFESLEYIAYQQGEPVLRQWMTQNLKRRNLKLNVKARVMDVQGVARLIGGGLGVGILPDHTYQGVKRYYKNMTVIGEGRKPVINQIHLAHLKGRSFSRGAQYILEELRQRL